MFSFNWHRRGAGAWQCSVLLCYQLLLSHYKSLLENVTEQISVSPQQKVVLIAKLIPPLTWHWSCSSG